MAAAPIVAENGGGGNRGGRADVLVTHLPDPVPMMSAVPLHPAPLPEPPLRRPPSRRSAARGSSDRPIVRRQPVAPRPAPTRDRHAPSAWASAVDAWAALVLASAGLTALALIVALALAPATTATATVLLAGGGAALLLSALPFAAWAIYWSARGVPLRRSGGRVLVGITGATLAAWLPVVAALGAHAL